MIQAQSPTTCGTGNTRSDCTALAAQPNSCYTGVCDTSAKACIVKARYVSTSHYFMLIWPNNTMYYFIIHTFFDSTEVCRAAAGVCDSPEFCTGSSGSCPQDEKILWVKAYTQADWNRLITSGTHSLAFSVNSGTVCRQLVSDPTATSSCDIAETCNGVSNDCPADTVQSSCVIFAGQLKMFNNTRHSLFCFSFIPTAEQYAVQLMVLVKDQRSAME